MFSYHRVLAVFGRSVRDKSLECDCDIHPWDIDINKEQWPGKIRLIAFVDVFFLISYSANASFEKGIIIYKDHHDIDTLLGNDQPPDIKGRESPKTADHDLSPGPPGKTPQANEVQYEFQSENDSSPTKPVSSRVKQEGSIKRGLEEHSILQLLGDDIRGGIIKQGQVTGHLISKYLANGVLDDALKKYVDGVVSTDRPGSMILSNDNVR
ncbi:hypothetical protein BDV30DRAFT_242538 [Aspergillus minisclerotigenes]|uniref:Uncharacterized protein n=1 Tax=Aspergillus minisclerotigenes TaxID=656917 RepID=A0A5N6ISK8_9EURO|nr:hypothetical protein BDV30DRAFT_242538 [Aspergillus minisclerotigenes]